ncbi:unnamed protein product [Urochloa decumbens]|uniref:ATP synthase mitochondrial F1 complex assembly factor 2 n=1 Tax=Urochloa decumbens TaxID=240449 RepID=A0ABC8ZKA8_9POAL
MGGRRRAGPAARHGGGGFSGRGGGARTRGRGRRIGRRDLREEAGGRGGGDDAGRDVRGDADVVHDGVRRREALLPRRHRAASRRWQRVDRDAGLPYPQVAGQAAVEVALARARHGHRRRVGVPDGIRPFTMPLMKLACTALERVPLTRTKVIDNLIKKFHQDLVFCRSPADSELTIGVHQKQKEKIDPILDWVNTEFGFKTVVYTTFLGDKQDEGLTRAVETVLKKTTDCELASIDAMAAAAHSLVIPLAIFKERLGIEEAIELIRLEEDHQVDRWGLVEGGHDVDIADLKVQMSSAVVFLGLSRGM